MKICFQLQEGDFHDQMRNCFNTLGQLEVDGGDSTKIGFQAVVHQANTVGALFLHVLLRPD